LNKNWRES